MRFIPTRIHGVMDYLMGLLLIVAPWVFAFADAPDRAAVYVPVILGIGALLYSLMTRYEFGLVPMIPMKGHLALDLMSGAFLAISPWLFQFSEHVYVPHLALGLLEIGAALMSRTTPEHEGLGDHSHHRGHRRGSGVLSH
jgi:hypothetical protein